METMTRLEKLEAICASPDFEARVRALLVDAGVHGDEKMVATCERALRDLGGVSALDCADVMLEAEERAS